MHRSLGDLSESGSIQEENLFVSIRVLASEISTGIEDDMGTVRIDLWARQAAPL